MLDRLLDKLSDDGSAELVYLVLGSVLLFAFQRLRAAFRQMRHRRFIKCELEAYKERKRAINVIDLANGDPEFSKNNIFLREVSIFGMGKCLYIDMRADHKTQLHAREKDIGYTDQQLTQFHADKSFDGTASFADLAEITKIPDLSALIERHRAIVGEQFLRSAEGMIFNGSKYGIYNLRFTRFGESESPAAEIDLFQTDYFTHRVFRSIYRELKEAGHPIAQAGGDNFLQYKPFLTSFGVNTVLICEGERGKEIVLSRRSGRVHGKPLFHITMNEGLSQTDKDAYGKVDLELCFKRGLLEELGLHERLYRLAVRGSFYDFFLEKNNFEIGVSSVLEMELNFGKDIEPLVGRDKALEADAFLTLPLAQAPIRQFVKSNINNFVPHGLYVLERVLLRENIAIEEGGAGQTRPAP
ncbi:hypothetical protein [Pollutimonas sp. M17]|uniref:hypothetical protein n=1 Tax=Pollutimonas sp. M17 TaxID=2962065 RepID=UPI0021F4BCCA|nr:hypothetical protein [Pollutimonas sp. M17]UYO93962.1 hypothetical protein OEG81_01120 [Pollutimonas sp. M17]